MMATNVATGLEIEGEDNIRPVMWEEWIHLPIREQDEAVRTVRGPIRVPTVIVATSTLELSRSPFSTSCLGKRARLPSLCMMDGIA